ncbi:MAG: hypothetical protein QNJ16_18420 [Rhodobacter sp.]|nr:hypothetical protein [Rhodobacter sp.]
MSKLAAAADRFEASDAETLAELCHSPTSNCAVAATWIAKALFEAGRADALDIGRIFAALGQAPHWEVALHILQMAQFAPKAAAAQLAEIARLLHHDKTLVRAWALDAYCRAATVVPAERPRARDLVQAALADPKASVRARARKLVALLDG